VRIRSPPGSLRKPTGREGRACNIQFTCHRHRASSAQARTSKPRLGTGSRRQTPGAQVAQHKAADDVCSANRLLEFHRTSVHRGARLAIRSRSRAPPESRQVATLGVDGRLPKHLQIGGRPEHGNSSAGP
jgi:hypothetical protein